MKSKLFTSQENIDNWSEILSFIDVSRVPIEYILIMRVYFLDKPDIWEINIFDQSKHHSFDDISTQVAEFLTSVESNIDHVDVEINFDRVKKTISKSIKKFFKKYKL